MAHLAQNIISGLLLLFLIRWVHGHLLIDIYLYPFLQMASDLYLKDGFLKIASSFTCFNFELQFLHRLSRRI